MTRSAWLTALQARAAALLTAVRQFRLGIGATLSIAFLAVAILAAAANLISERSSQIVRTTRSAAPSIPVVKPVRVRAAPEPATAATPRAVSVAPVIAATERYAQAVQSRLMSADEGFATEHQNAAGALQRATDDLLRDVRDRSSSSSRRAIANVLREYQAAATAFVQSADDRRSLLVAYSERYDAMHTRARNAIDSAWKIFGRVVARQALVTLNRQVEDLGRNSAGLVAASGNIQTIAALIAADEAAIATTLRENDRSLSGSQGKEWVATMNADLAMLTTYRERLIAQENMQEGLRTQLNAFRGDLENQSRSIVADRAPVRLQHTKQTAAVVVANPSSQRGHHSPRYGRISNVTTINHDAGHKTLLAWISAGVLLLVVLVCVVTVRSVVGPVRRLVQATSRLAEGDLETRVVGGGIKELATLATAFNIMAGRLAQAERITRDYQAELEAEVAQRTQQLRQLASSDALTSLPNRRELFILLNAALKVAEAGNRRVAVFFMDLDNFKNINDGMGHAFGDQVLKAMAARLESTVAGFGFAARLGGDEFTVVMTNAGSLEEVEAAGLRLIDAFDDPLRVGGRDLILSVSVGASVFPDHERDADALLRAADAAVFRAKALGRSQLTMYSPELLATAASKFAIEQGLRVALEKEQFELVFQPELSLATMKVELVEALIRWRQSDGRLLPPGEFLAVAEESGLIMEISDWVLRSAISTAARWHHGPWPEARVAINVSSRQLIDSTFVDRVRDLLQQYRLPPRCIEIELTESVLQTGPVTLEALRQLRAHGIAIALDDFGTGYSSLTSLQQLPLSRIKLDRSLLEDIDSSPRTLAITRSIIALSRSLGLAITAEGLERAEQLSVLLDEGDMFVQGYLLSRPVREPELIATLTSVVARCESLLLPSVADTASSSLAAKPVQSSGDVAVSIG